MEFHVPIYIMPTKITTRAKGRGGGLGSAGRPADATKRAERSTNRVATGNGAREKHLHVAAEAPTRPRLGGLSKPHSTPKLPARTEQTGLMLAARCEAAASVTTASRTTSKCVRRGAARLTGLPLLATGMFDSLILDRDAPARLLRPFRSRFCPNAPCARWCLTLENTRRLLKWN